MSTDLDMRLKRVRRIVEEADEHGDIFTPTELELLLEDSQKLYTKESAKLIEILITRQLPAARAATNIHRTSLFKLETFQITDDDVEAVMEAYRAEGG